MQGICAPSRPLAQRWESQRSVFGGVKVSATLAVLFRGGEGRRKDAMMGENTKIEWASHTFNIAWGCEKVSPACDHCYAEAWAKRAGLAVWGADAPRRVMSAEHWKAPPRWNAAAAKAGVVARVFCSSMADVFEDH